MFLLSKRSRGISLLFLLLAGCSGGDGGTPALLSGGTTQKPVTPTGVPPTVPTPPTVTPPGSTTPTKPTVMRCQGSGNVHCSGDTILRTDEGITVTASGVQAYGISTTDLLTPNPDATGAKGLRATTGGLAEVRLQRSESGSPASVALLLSNMGISWDGVTERPPVIETFSTQQGRVEIDANGQIVLKPLPAFTDINFYDYATKGAAGTQAHYANNIYFPRTEPVRCPVDHPNCPQVESPPLRIMAGDWKTGGSTPDTLVATHLHGDGATQAGSGVDANGNLVLLSSADGVGVSYPGFKGYRDYGQWSFSYANAARWVTQDTVMINEWGGNDEHNKLRRGTLAFGDVSDPASIPTTGVVSYTGKLYGWFTYNDAEDPHPLAGEIEIVVDFATRSAQVTLSGTRIDEGESPAVPINLVASTTIGAAEFANYFNGHAENSSVAGGLGARFFGPVSAGGSGTGPAEVAGSFSLKGSGGGAVAIGSFLLLKK